MSKNLPLLWHIPLSHFNEKVRWALDFKNIPHRRQRVGADYLFRGVARDGHGTLPILFLDGKPIGDSTAIIAALEQRSEPALYPKDAAQLRRALELEDYLDEVLGPSLRAAIVTPAVPRRPGPRLARADDGHAGAGLPQLAALGRIFPAYYRFRHKIKAQRLEQDRADVTRARPHLARAAAERLPRRRDILGRGPHGRGAASRAAAARGDSVSLTVALPDSLRQYRDDWRATRRHGWALEIYRRHRGRSAEVRRGTKLLGRQIRSEDSLQEGSISTSTPRRRSASKCHCRLCPIADEVIE